MTIRAYIIPTITLVGANGSAVGSGQTVMPVNGRLIGFLIAQGGTPAATSDLTITQVDPALTLLTLTDTNTAALVKYPRALVQGADGANLTGVYEALPVWGYIQAAVAQGNGGQTLDVTVLVDERR